MTEAVLVEVRDNVLVMTIDRPEARNAVNAAVAQGLAAALDQLFLDGRDRGRFLCWIRSAVRRMTHSCGKESVDPTPVR